MVDAKPTSKRGLQQIFADLGERKLILVSTTGKMQDSRYVVQESCTDHVVIKLLGEETLVLPFSAITSIKLERQQATINYR